MIPSCPNSTVLRFVMQCEAALVAVTNPWRRVGKCNSINIYQVDAGLVQRLSQHCEHAWYVQV